MIKNTDKFELDNKEPISVKDALIMTVVFLVVASGESFVDELFTLTKDMFLWIF